MGKEYNKQRYNALLKIFKKRYGVVFIGFNFGH